MKDIKEIKERNSVAIIQEELKKQLVMLPPEEILELFGEVLRGIVGKGQAEAIKAVIETLEIISTKTAFDGGEAQQILEEVAREYPLREWMKSMKIEVIGCKELMDYWEFFMDMAEVKGFKARGINAASQSNNLWKATGALAESMSCARADYGHLDPGLINNVELVVRALGHIKKPGPWFEVLVGESLVDMKRSKIFMGAFSLLEGKDEYEGAMATIKMALQQQ